MDGLVFPAEGRYAFDVIVDGEHHVSPFPSPSKRRFRARAQAYEADVPADDRSCRNTERGGLVEEVVRHSWSPPGDSARQLRRADRPAVGRTGLPRSRGARSRGCAGTIRGARRGSRPCSPVSRATSRSPPFPRLRAVEAAVGRHRRLSPRGNGARWSSRPTRPTKARSRRTSTSRTASRFSTGSARWPPRWRRSIELVTGVPVTEETERNFHFPD